MAGARARRRTERPDYWPAFVDVLSNLLLVFVFLLSIFALVQFFLNREISGRDTILDSLRDQIAELNDLLSMEKNEGLDLADALALMQSNLNTAEAERARLQGLLDNQGVAANNADGQVAALTRELVDERNVSARALSQIELLNQQIAAMRRQLAALEEALDAADAKDRQAQTQIAQLGQRLNVALAQRVQELSRYRSDFFGRLREILGNREDIRVVGDRFVFQSEVLFATGSDELNVAGREELAKLASAIIQLEAEIPSEINWVLQVNGHTDSRPMAGGGRIRDNLDLSTARAGSVVRFLIEEGIPPNRLVAAGYGEHQPLEPGNSEEVFARNRRIELKLTEG